MQPLATAKTNLRPDRPLSLRVPLADGAHTTVHVIVHERQRIVPRVVVFDRPRRLVEWCRAGGLTDAVVGGFFDRALVRPLGEVWTQGVQHASTPFETPWDRERPCLHVEPGSTVNIAARQALPGTIRGDLLQAGPLLVTGGRSVIQDGADPDGFSTASHQFDTDITIGRYPRAAVGLSDEFMWSVACDGRHTDDAGLTLAELAEVFIMLGADSALNLDGGGSASLVAGGRLLNTPRGGHGTAGEGRPIHTAIAFVPR